MQCIWNAKKKNEINTSNNRGNLGHLKSFSKHLSNIPGNHEIRELLTTAILGTAHMLRKVLMLKYRTFNMGHNITCTFHKLYLQNSCNTIHPRNMVCFRYIIVNTLQKK